MVHHPNLEESAHWGFGTVSREDGDRSVLFRIRAIYRLWCVHRYSWRTFGWYLGTYPYRAVFPFWFRVERDWLGNRILVAELFYKWWWQWGLRRNGPGHYANDLCRLDDLRLDTGLEGIFYYVSARMQGAASQKNPLPFDRRYREDLHHINSFFDMDDLDAFYNRYPVSVSPFLSSALLTEETFVSASLGAERRAFRFFVETANTKIMKHLYITNDHETSSGNGIGLISGSCCLFVRCRYYDWNGLVFNFQGRMFRHRRIDGIRLHFPSFSI